MVFNFLPITVLNFFQTHLIRWNGYNSSIHIFNSYQTGNNLFLIRIPMPRQASVRAAGKCLEGWVVGKQIPTSVLHLEVQDFRRQEQPIH